MNHNNNFIKIDNLNISGLEIPICTPDPQWDNSSWVNISCIEGDLMNQSKEVVYYDLNGCNETNQTWTEYQTTEYCDFCVPQLTNTSWSEWANDGCSLDQMTQSRYLIEYDENNCGEIVNETYYEYQSVGPIYFNTSWSEWFNDGDCLINDLQQQTRNLTEYDTFGCVSNQTYYDFQNITCDYCIPNRVNSSWSEWYYIVECQENDTRTKEQNLTEYDENNCYEITGLEDDSSPSILFFNYSSEVCDFCTPYLIYTSWSEWSNLTCVVNQMNQSRSRILYDDNFCNETENSTESEYQLVGPNYINESWNEWESITECRENDTILQERNLTSSESYSCGEDIIYYEYQEIVCDYCTPSMINITIQDWTNESCLEIDLMNQSKEILEYDENSCGETENQTYIELRAVEYCDYCTPNITVDEWSEWQNISCIEGDLMNQSRTRILFDNNFCGEIENDTETEYRATEYCSYCTSNLVNTSWSEWINEGSCLINDIQEQTRSLTQYDENGCVANETFYEYQNVTCDYCTPNLVNNSWSEWQNESCVSGQMNQSQYLIEYDNNLCGEVENNTYFNFQLVGPNYQNTTWTDWINEGNCLINDNQQQVKNLTQYDSYGCGTNNTFYDYKNITCDYCIPNRVNSSWTEWNYVSECQENDTIFKERNMTEYDSNYCYEITGLSSDFSKNITYHNESYDSCDYCTPNLVNTSWSEWIDLENQLVRNLTQYDENNCNEISNKTFSEYKNKTISIVNNTENITIDNNTLGEIKITLPQNISQSKQILNFTDYTSNNTLNLSQKVILIRETLKTNYTVEIQANTTIQGNENWTGLIILPTVSEVPLEDNKIINSSIKVGDENHLNLTTAAKIVIEGMNGTTPFWYNNVSGENEITRCDASANSTSPGNLTIGKECYTLDENKEDIIIWTYHFTTFGTYTTTTDNTINDPSSGGPSSNPTCTTEWTCTEWSTCVDGTQTRICSYPDNFCEPVFDKPNETQSCIVEPAEIEEPEIIIEEEPTFFQSLFTGLVTGTVETFRNPAVSWIVPSVTLALAIIALIYISIKNKKNKKKKDKKNKKHSKKKSRKKKKN